MFTFRAIKIVLLISILSYTLYGKSVDPLTGRAIINLPLGEIRALDLSASVSLSHHGGALRVNEGPGNAGMGWNVNVGGSIVREVRGLPDDYTKNNDIRKGWLYNGNAQTAQGFTPTADDNLAVCTDEAADWNILNNVLWFKNDPEPDMFYFNAPGISGKFVFGADGLPKLIPYQNLTVTFSGGNFSIKTNTGITYSFGSIEPVTREAVQYKNNVPVDALGRDFAYYQLPMNFATTWKLLSITSSTTGAAVNFNYSPLKESASIKYVTRIYPNISNSADTLYYVKDEYTPQVITKIQASDYSIDLTWMNSEIYNVTLQAGGDIRSYDFIYKLVVGDNTFGTPIKRFLMQVKQQNNCVALSPFIFNYVGVDTTVFSPSYSGLVNLRVNMPWKTGWGEDFFGYYNGQDNNKNIPTVYFYQNETGARRYRVTPIPGLTATQVLSGNGGMVPNNLFANFGCLSSIIYPTGGFTNFNYEVNKYLDSSTGEQLMGPGVRVSSITTGGGAPAYGKALKTNLAWTSLTKNYQYSTDDTGTTTSGKILYPPSFAYTDGTTIYRSQSDLGQGSQVLYARVKETISGQGYRVYKYDLPNMYPDVAPIASKSKVARVAGSACPVGLLMNGLYNFPFAPNQDLDYMRGLPTRVTEYAQNGTLTRETRRAYLNLGSGATVKGVKFEPFEEVMGTNYHYSSYEIPVNQSRILWKEYSKVVGDQSQADSTTVVTTYIYNAQNMVVQTTQTNDDGSESKSFIKYAQDFNITAPAVSDVQANAIFKLNGAIANRSGEVIETYQKFKPIGGVENYNGAQLNIFKENLPGDSRILLYQRKSFPQGLAFAPATNTTTNFTADIKYIPGPTNEYNNALLINQTDPVTSISNGTHYASGLSTPVANFFNCKAENAVYEGFEFVNDKGLMFTGAIVYQQGWTGKNAASIAAGAYLSTISTVVKATNTYRVSFWAKSSQAKTINLEVLVGATSKSTLVLNIAGTNQWTYLENLVDVTTVAPSTTFSFKLSTSSTTPIGIDDFVALPSIARVSHNTFLPLTGITSQSDDRGNSTVINYDGLGRKISTLDRKRNLVEVQEYGLQKVGAIELTAGFTSNLTHFMKSTQATFTAAPTCLSQVSYEWKIFDPVNPTIAITLPSTLNQVNWTPSTFGLHKVQLTVSRPGYPSVSTIEDFCVEMYGMTLGLAAACTHFPAITNTNIYTCSPVDDGVRTFTATLPETNFPGWTLAYGWVVKDVDGASVPGVTFSGSSIEVPLYTKTYVVYCTAVINKNGQTYPFSDCNKGMALATQSYTINYIVNTPCQ